MLSPQSNGYRLPGPEEGEIGPPQIPFRFAAGTSWLSHHTVSFPSFRRTSIISALDVVSL